MASSIGLHMACGLDADLTRLGAVPSGKVWLLERICYLHYFLIIVIDIGFYAVEQLHGIVVCIRCLIPKAYQERDSLLQ